MKNVEGRVETNIVLGNANWLNWIKLESSRKGSKRYVWLENSISRMIELVEVSIHLV